MGKKKITIEDIIKKLDKIEGHIQNLEGDIQNLKGEYQNLKIFIVRVVAQGKRYRKRPYWLEEYIGIGTSASGPSYHDPRILKDI